MIKWSSGPIFTPIGSPDLLRNGKLYMFWQILEMNISRHFVGIFKYNLNYKSFPSSPNLEKSMFFQWNYMYAYKRPTKKQHKLIDILIINKIILAKSYKQIERNWSKWQVGQNGIFLVKNGQFVFLSEISLGNSSNTPQI